MTDEELMAEAHVKADLLRGIRELRLIDDVYFTVFFDNFKEGMEVILAPILDRPDIRVKSVVTQRTAPNLYGRSARFDVLAIDSEGKYYNCEVQRASKDADPRRARFNSSMLDAREVDKGTPYRDFPETYVIFITESDVFKRGRPRYEIDRTFRDTHESFGDGAHIIYVNGECRDDTALGRVMQDFFCENPADMHSPILADRAGFFKDKPEGVSGMGEILEGIMKKRVQEAERATAEKVEKDANRKTAVNLLNLGLAPDVVAKATSLSPAEVKALDEARTA